MHIFILQFESTKHKESVDFLNGVNSNSFFNARSMPASHPSLRSFCICTILWSSLILSLCTLSLHSGPQSSKIQNAVPCVPCVVRLDTKATESGEWQWQNVCNLRIVVLTGRVKRCQQETQVGTRQARSSPRQVTAALHRVRVSQTYLLRWSGQNRSSTSFLQYPVTSNPARMLWKRQLRRQVFLNAVCNVWSLGSQFKKRKIFSYIINLI